MTGTIVHTRAVDGRRRADGSVGADSRPTSAAEPHPLFGHRLFEGVSDSDLRKVAADVKQRSYPKGQYLCYAGDRAHALFVIKSGLVALTEVDERGNPHAVHVFGPQDVFGAMVALLGKPHTGSAIAMIDTETVVIPDHMFARLVREFPGLAVNVIRELYGIVCRAEETIMRLTVTGVASRVAALLLKLRPLGAVDSGPVTIEPRLSHETIALLLGTTRRTVTRAFTNLTRANLISMKRQRVVILAPDKLRELAEGRWHEGPDL